MIIEDEPAGQRVNQERAQEAINTGADILAVGCPFCMTMMEDGVGARKGERDIKVMDVSELLWEAMKSSERRDDVHRRDAERRRGGAEKRFNPSARPLRSSASLR